jgi:hypothetical protein
MAAAMNAPFCFFNRSTEGPQHEQVVRKVLKVGMAEGVCDELHPSGFISDDRHTAYNHLITHTGNMQCTSTSNLLDVMLRYPKRTCHHCQLPTTRGMKDTVDK